ncbi:MAG: DUF4276 family protein [Caldilineaceae bacterium SB0665_bin_25]|nr:DUF4276 family protein [Caldilineaceae bacterium SB0665_bin_25]
MAQRRAWRQSLVRVRLYVEGGSSGGLDSRCRKAFSEFFKKAGLSGHMPKVIACGSRTEAFKRFRTALTQADSEAIPLLLVDAETHVAPQSASWQHLNSRDGWQRPSEALDEQAHLMVQIMESWFLADVPSLEKYFGNNFRSASLTNRESLEDVPKNDVLNQLKLASRDSQKGTYDKGSHSFAILAQIDPEKVIQRSRFAKRLIDTLKSYLIPT